MVYSPVCFIMLTDIISSNPIPHVVVPFFGSSTFTNHNNKWGRRKGGRQQLINFNHKGKHKTGCYPKYLLLFTEYKVQVWWTMILSPVQSHPDGINVR